MKIRWTLLAIHDFNEAQYFIASERPSAAYRLASDTKQLLAHLCRYPHLGKPGREENIREIHLPRFPYMIAYQVKENTIEIMRFLHDKQFWQHSE